MHDDRLTLLHGPYQMPKCRMGRNLFRAIRGRVAVPSLFGASIPEPLCKVRKGGRARAFILCGDLAHAV